MRIILLLVCLIAGNVVAVDVNKSIVKIYNTANAYNYSNPWLAPVQDKGTGSGFVISGNRIMTNAHVISNSAFIEIRKAGDSKRYVAAVEYVGHDCDLAILKPLDKKFFDGTTALHLGIMPKMLDKVRVFGFPMGGDKISITSGVVSRIEIHEYAHSGASLLTTQIDAAINPGNSGGPAIVDNRVIGVAFQGIDAGQNLGYIIPINIVKHFLKDIKNAQYTGFPSIGVNIQAMENKVLRASYGMHENQTGVLITQINPHSQAKKILKINDVLLDLNSVKIANDATIKLENGLRVGASYLISKAFVGDTVRATIMRDRKILTVEIPLQETAGFNNLVKRTIYDKAPSYYIYAGLVFQPLTQNYLSTYGRDWIYIAPKKFLNYFVNGNFGDKKQVVILSSVLSDALNVGYQNFYNEVIRTVNGKKINDIRDIITALKNHKGGHDTFIFEGNSQIILDRKQVVANQAKLLKKYRIVSDRSRDLK